MPKQNKPTTAGRVRGQLLWVPGLWRALWLVERAVSKRESFQSEISSWWLRAPHPTVCFSCCCQEFCPSHLEGLEKVGEEKTRLGRSCVLLGLSDGSRTPRRVINLWPWQPPVVTPDLWLRATDSVRQVQAGEWPHPRCPGKVCLIWPTCPDRLHSNYTRKKCITIQKYNTDVTQLISIWTGSIEKKMDCDKNAVYTVILHLLNKYCKNQYQLIIIWNSFSVAAKREMGEEERNSEALNGSWERFYKWIKFHFKKALSGMIHNVM